METTSLNKLRIIITIFLLLSAKMLLAQPYYFKHYQVENGLSNNSVFSNVQDQNGFMWFGTKDGLNRFDGYSFKTFRHDPAVSGSLGSNKIHALLSEKTAGLWVGTERGLYQFNADKETFNPVKETLQMPITAIQIDLDGNLWILSTGKVYTYNPLRKTFTPVKLDSAFVANTLYCRPNGQVLVISYDARIASYHHLSRSFVTFHEFNAAGKQHIGNISTVTETDDQQLLIGTTNKGLKRFNLKTKILKELITINEDKTNIFVRDIQALNNHEFWIGTESGLYIYNHLNGRITHLQKQYSNPYTLSDNAIYALCSDRDGGMWMGTYFGGINYYSSTAAIFTKYFPRQQQNSISGSDVREICKDQNGDFWIGTEDAGLNKLNPATGRFTAYAPNGTRHSIAHSNIHALFANGNELWVSSFEHGLDIMNIHTGKVIRRYQEGKGNTLKSNFVLSIYKTKAGKILLATTTGMYLYNTEKLDFDPLPNLPRYFFNSIFEDSEGTLWAGTFNDGLFSFKLGSESHQQYKNNLADKNSLAHNTINSIFEDSRKNLWITTDGGGLSLFDRRKSTFSTYNTNDGFPSNFLFRIEEDHDYKLWISSTRGLIRFNPLDKKIKVYTKADGLLTDQFNYSSSFKDSDGRMYFGSLKGLISFQPDQLHTTSKIAALFLTGFRIDNTGSKSNDENAVLSNSILNTKKIILQHDQSSFSIDFAALSYHSPEETEYAYKMTGLYKDWEYLKTNRKVYFTKLAPGDYVFEAKAMVNGSIAWSKDNIRLHITVLPPFWKTKLAYSGYAFLLLSFITIIILRYHNKTQVKNKRRMELFEHKKEKEIYQAKIEFFTNVAHEIRTPLTLIKGPMEKMIHSVKEVPHLEKNLQTMNRNTDRLLNLTNQLLDFRKTEINGFSLNFVKANIGELLQDIALQFHNAAEQKNICYETILPPEKLFAYVDVEAFYKIMSNLVDNAIKYGKAEVKVTLHVDEEQEQFYIWIRNDGPQIPIELKEKIFEPFFRAREVEIKPGTGIGLSISRSLAELHKGHLRLEECGPGYNIFVVSFPVHQTMGFNLEGKWKKM
jgi:signal transduction histidine kinase/ligand-binding sensor domain-containing protein